MKVAAADRRVAPRHNFKTTFCDRIWKSAIPEQRAESEILSEKGNSFATDSLLPVRTTVETLLKMPDEITGEPTTAWLCTGHFVYVAGGLFAGQALRCRAVRSLSDFPVHDRLARGK